VDTDTQHIKHGARDSGKNIIKGNESKNKNILFIEILFTSSSAQYETDLKHGFAVLLMWYICINGFSRG
jgi:hypothetical protein